MHHRLFSPCAALAGDPVYEAAVREIYTERAIWLIAAAAAFWLELNLVPGAREALTNFFALGI